MMAAVIISLHIYAATRERGTHPGILIAVLLAALVCVLVSKGA